MGSQRIRWTEDNAYAVRKDLVTRHRPLQQVSPFGSQSGQRIPFLFLFVFESSEAVSYKGKGKFL